MKLKQEKIINGKTYIGDFLVEDLVNKYDSPLFVFDEEQLIDNILKYTNNFTNEQIECKTVYASKAFIAPYLIKLISKYNLYIDAISLNDLLLLKKANFNLAHIVYHGNNKSEEELNYAISNDIGLIVVDNITELKLIDKLTTKLNKSAKIMLRVNPGIEAHTHAYIQTSLISSKFGESIYDEEVYAEFFKITKNNKYLNMVGFHAHIGSQINNSTSFTELVKVMIKFMSSVNKKYQVDLSELNYGGGFSIKYLDSDPILDIKSLLKEMINTTLLLSKEEKVNLKRIYIEPGRSIVGDCCLTLYKCGGTKKTYSGLTYAFIDGGMGDNIRVSLYEAKYTFKNLSNPKNDCLNKFSIAGKCCESGDILGSEVILQTPQKDDIIASYSTGAYCYSMSMNYNMFSRPGVIFINKDVINVGIKKETIDDITTCFIF